MTKSNSSQPEVQRVEIARLRPHPSQAEYFAELPEEQLVALATDMETNGLQHPIEILSDFSIVAGHQRVAAAIRLGWTEIDAIIRADLEQQGDAAIEAYLISDNLRRRQLTGLERARCIRALLTLRLGQLSDRGIRRMKQEIGEQLGLNARSVNRYLLVLKTPPEVQAAFDSGKISLVDAGKIAGLPSKKQAEMAKKLAAGEDAKQVVRDYIAPRKGLHQRAESAFASLVGHLERDLSDLEGRSERVPTGWIREKLPVLQQGRQLLTELIRSAQTDTVASGDVMEEAVVLASRLRGSNGQAGKRPRPASNVQEVVECI